MNDPERARWQEQSLLLAIAAAWLTVAYMYGRDLVPAPDAGFYAEAATGNYGALVQPFSKRVAAPFVAGLLVRQGWALFAAFWAITAVSLVGLLAAVRTTLTRYGVPKHPGVLLATVGTPALMTMVKTVYMPDLLHTALVAVLVGVIAVADGRVQRLALAVAVLLLAALAQVTREATLLVVLVGGGLALLRRRWEIAAALVVGMMVGNMWAAPFVAQGQGNVHGLGGGLYLLLKVPFNALSNLAGTRLWTNTFARLPGQCTPVAVMVLPDVLQRGDVHEIGRCAWNGLWMLHVYIATFTVFGVLPGFVAGLTFRRQAVAAVRSAWPLALAFAWVYGVLSFVIGPMLGAGVDRLLAYGWPAFWIATPVLAVWANVPRRDMAAVIAWTVGLAWAGWAMPESPRPLLLGLALFAVAVYGQVMAFRLGRRAAFPLPPRSDET
ncbi:MAG: hypothetical protein LCH53_08950 [Bacteroidetes bacterium]|nr:hypothetical protein [Bacteroidota bacterium]